MPHLVVNFKLLNNSKFQKHPKRCSDHGVVVQREVIEMKLINAQLTAQGNLCCLREKQQSYQSNCFTKEGGKAIDVYQSLDTTLTHSQASDYVNCAEVHE